MPVLVTGAESGAGRATVRVLLRGGGEVRVFLDAERSADEDAANFRRAGCKAALGTLDDEAHLETALEQVHTVVHLAGGPLEDPGDQLDALATVTSAAIGAGCRRFLWVTELAATEPVGNAYLQAQHEGADLVSDLPMETVVLRCAVRYGPEDALTGALAGLPRSEARSDARHAPLFLDDLAGTIAVADRHRGSEGDLRLTVELVGPDEITLGELVDRLPRADAVLTALPPWVIDWLSRDALGGSQALGRQGTPLAEGIARLTG